MLGVLLAWPAPSAASSGGMAFVQPLTTSLVFRNPSRGKAFGVAQGDFDDDGNLDLAVTGRSNLAQNEEGGFVYILLGLGNGRFEPPSRIALPRTASNQQALAYGLLAKDFDDDGSLDLLTVSPELLQLLFYKGLGDGTFAAAVTSETTASYISVQAGDVDGDEVLDVVVGAGASVELLQGDGDGGFVSQAVRNAADPTDIALADIDNDGDLDLVVSNWAEFLMRVFFNEEGQLAASGTPINFGKQVAGFFIDHFDDDDLLDIVAAGPFGNCGNDWVLVRGIGGGAFETPGPEDCIRGAVTPNTVGIKRFGENVAPDLNGDGRADLLFFGPGNNFERGLQREAGGFDLDMWAMTAGPGYDHPGHGGVDCIVPRSFTTGDFNGDGRIDVVVAGENGNGCRAGGVSIVLGAADDTYRSVRFQRARYGFSGARAFLLGDWNEDGHIDLLASRPEVALSFGRGDGSFLPQNPTIPNTSCSGEMRSGDFDEDGFADFACVSRFGIDALVAFGNGQGGFDVRHIPFAGADASQIVRGDFNEDGLADFGVLNIGGCTGICNSANLHLYLSDVTTPRTLMKHPQIVEFGPPDNQFAHGLATGDFNGDGHLDLVFRAGRRIGSPGSSDDRFMVVRGNGDGTFLPALTTSPQIFFIADLKPFDFDRDGRLDLIAVNSGGIWFLRGNGDATFQPGVFYATGASNAFEAEIADLDGDGFEDVALSSGFFGFSSPLSIFKGNGDGTFQSRVRFPTGYDGSRSIEIGDVNEDGRLDIVAATVEGDRNDNFAVLLNETALPDLEVTAVSAPANATPGELITVTYTVRNAATDFADGVWEDRVYLSADDVVDEDDQLIGSVPQDREVGAGATYEGSLTAPLPGEVPGLYRVIVVADGNGNLGETEEDDNQASAPLTVGEVPLLVDGIATMGSIRSGELRYFRYVPQPGSALLFSATLEVANQIELYSGIGRPPNRTRFDRKYEFPADTLQTFNYAATVSGTYYVLLYGAGAAGAGGRPFSITARELGLEITSLTRPNGSNQGSISFSILGAKFTGETEFTLVSGATVRTADSIVFVSPDRVDVTFDLTGLQTGAFDVVASDGDRSFTRTGGFTVTSGPPGRIEAKLSVPFNILVRWTGTATVTLKNTGETDAPPSWFHLRITSGNAAFALPDGTEKESVWFTPFGALARVPPTAGAGRGTQTGPPAMTSLGTFGPGAEVTLAFPYHCTNNMPGDVTFELDELVGPEDFLDPAKLKEDLKPEWAPAEAWDAVWDSFTARAGADLKQLPAVLRDSAKTLGALGQPVKDWGALLMLELDHAGLTRIAARYLQGSFGRGRPAPWDLVATTGADGTAHIRLGPAVRSFGATRGGGFSGSPGEIATLSSSGGAYTLREGDGTLMRFRTDGRVDHIEDSNGNRITYNYSGSRVVGRSFSNGDQETFGYNGAGLIASVTNAVGRTTTYTYDGDGHLMTESGPLDGTTSYTYRLGGNPRTRHAVATITTPDQVTQSFIYEDTHGQLIRIQKTGGAERFEIDYPSNRCVRTSSALNGATTVCTNGGGQAARVIDALGRVIVNRYDVAGNRTRTIWADGSASIFGHDAKGNVILHTARDGATSSELVYHSFLNRLTQVRDPRRRTTLYKLDAKGNTIGIVDPAMREEVFGYDARGRLASTTNRRGQTTLYGYNAVDDIVSRTPPGEEPIVFGYDTRRNLTSVEDASGTTIYDYDDFDRLEAVIEPNGRSLDLEYDGANRRTRSTDQSDFTVLYEYDTRGRLWKVTDAQGVPWVTYTYDDVNRLRREDKGNGTYTTYDYDLVGRLQRIENRGPNQVVQSFFEYGYDVMDRPETVTTLEGVTRFEYDLRDQLTVIHLPDGRVIRYGYDAAGNRSSVQDGGATTNYAVNDLNQYTSGGGANFSYDNDGNRQTRSGGFVYSWDADNRLVGITSPGLTRTFAYNVDGFLRQRTENGVTTHFHSDPLGLINLVGEYDDGGQALARWVHGLGLVARVDSSGTAWYGFEGAGSTTETTDAGGSPVNRYDHLPFGERRTVSERTPEPFSFGGRAGVVRDGDLHWMRARWYDPALGRFLGQDPLGIDGGDLNLYRYVGNTPVLNADPSGLTWSGFLPPPGPALVTETAIEVLVSSTPAFEYGAYGVGSGALSGSSSAWGTAEGLMAAGGLEAERQAIQLAPRAAPPAQGIGNATTRVVARNGTSALTRGGAGALARGLLSRGLGVVGVGVTAYQLTRFGIEHTASGRAMDKYLYDKFYARYTDEYLHPKDKTLEDKSFYKALDCFGREDDPDCKLYFERVRPHEKGKTRKTAAKDPNSITGPPGFGPENWISPEQPFPYTIRFENVSTATAPAAEVIIDQTLDADFDPATFELANFGWAAVHVELEPGTTSVQRRVDVRDTIGLYVDVEATFNTETRVVRWHFTAIDPDTGELPGPESPSFGFLFPNDETGRGDGFVGYRVRPRADAPTGTRIDAQARIVFDTNEPIDTPAIFHTLDGEDPTSQAGMLAENTAGGQILLSWSGMDTGGSGLATYTVWVSINGEPYYPILVGSTDTAAAFAAEIGRTYRFYVVAVDNAGNLEMTPAVADATTLVVAVLPTATPQTPNPTPTTTPMSGSCAGDCDGSDDVTVDELITGVNIALGTREVLDCPPFDTSDDGVVTVDEILQAVNRALNGC